MTYTPEGWHPDPTTDDTAMIELLRDELDACKAEIQRLREQNRLQVRILNDRGVQSMGCGVFRVTAT